MIYTRIDRENDLPRGMIQNSKLLHTQCALFKAKDQNQWREIQGAELLSTEVAGCNYYTANIWDVGTLSGKNNVKGGINLFFQIYDKPSVNEIKWFSNFKSLEMEF